MEFLSAWVARPLFVAGFMGARVVGAFKDGIDEWAGKEREHYGKKHD